MNVEIEELMHQPVVTAQRHHKVGHIRSLMVKNKVSAIPIVNTDNEAIGMVTATDLLDFDTDGAAVSSMMSEPVYTVPRYSAPHVAARIMRNHHLHHIVVTDSHKVVGMVSAYDLLRLTEQHRYVAKPGPTPSAKGKRRV